VVFPITTGTTPHPFQTCINQQERVLVGHAVYGRAWSADRILSRKGNWACLLHSASRCELSPWQSRQRWSISSTPAVSESIRSVGLRRSWRSRKASLSSKRQNWLASAAGRPSLTWSSASIAADWRRSRSVPAEDGNRPIWPALGRGSSRLPSDHPTGAGTGQRHGH
jgi:hypothetical protein